MPRYTVVVEGEFRTEIDASDETAAMVIAETEAEADGPGWDVISSGIDHWATTEDEDDEDDEEL